MEERKKSIADKSVPKKVNKGGATGKTAEKKDSKANAVGNTAERNGSGKYGKKGNAKPWEKMYEGKGKAAGTKPVTGKAEGNAKAGAKNAFGKAAVTSKAGAKNASGKAAVTSKAVGKDVAGKTPAAKNAKKAPVRELRDFLYLLPKRTSAKNLAKTLTFLERKNVEIWEDECVLEITTEGSTITFEDIRDSLEKEDVKKLSDLRMKQVLSCDYESTDAEIVRKVMTAFLKEFGGKIASDTEDFTPFLDIKEL